MHRVFAGHVYLTGFYIPSDEENAAMSVDDQTNGKLENNVHAPDTPNGNLQTKYTLDQGVMVEEVITGSGDQIKVGDIGSFFYETRIGDKIVSRYEKDGGYSLQLGKNEVMKAWDIGIPGMKTGGKRRLTCPPNSAYGEAGLPPVIPQNVTLVCEISLVNIVSRSESIQNE